MQPFCLMEFWDFSGHSRRTSCGENMSISSHGVCPCASFLYPFCDELQRSFRNQSSEPICLAQSHPPYGLQSLNISKCFAFMAYSLLYFSSILHLWTHLFSIFSCPCFFDLSIFDDNWSAFFHSISLYVQVTVRVLKFFLVNFSCFFTPPLLPNSVYRFCNF